jgi:glycerol-1-phosphate dehydrogenase [NAD(P)+]
MPLLARTVQTPLTIDIRPGAIAGLATVMTDRRICASGDAAVVVGPGLGPEIADIIRGTFSPAEIITIAGGTLDDATELSAKLRARSFEAVAAIGGGKVIDTAKYAASQVAMPMVSVATSLAHDGLASPVSVLEHRGAKISYGVHPPFAVLVDLDFVRRGPLRQIRSGVGDALSNLSAIADWQLAHEVRGEPIDGLAVALASSGAEALIGHPGAPADDDFLGTLANALVLGGIAMAVTGSSRPCSGGCHEIAHALTQLRFGSATHGELVAVGALFCSFLRADHRLFEKLKAAYQRYGLPLVPSDLAVDNEQFIEAVMLAPATRPGRYTILEHLAMTRPQVSQRLSELLEVFG